MDNEKPNKLILNAKEIITNVTKEAKTIIVDFAAKVLEKEITKVKEARDYENEPEKIVLSYSGIQTFKTEEELREVIGKSSKVIPIGLSAMVLGKIFKHEENEHLSNLVKKKTDKFNHVKDVFIEIEDGGDSSACTQGEVLSRKMFSEK